MGWGQYATLLGSASPEYPTDIGMMVSYAVCADIDRNNTGTVTGAMNFFGQMGALFLALIFGQMVQATHRFDYPVYVVGAVLLLGCLLWLAIDAEKQLPETGDGVKIL